MTEREKQVVKEIANILELTVPYESLSDDQVGALQGVIDALRDVADYKWLCSMR